jgi:stage V sporulation protein R
MEVRESDRDVAFLRRFLTEELCRELDLFTWKPRGEHLVVSQISDEEHWDDVKGALLRQIGMGGFPVIRIKDAGYRGTRALYLVHDHDGRDLDMTHAERTLEHLRTLWSNDVVLETRMRGKSALMTYTSDGFDAKLMG